jgi:hypothetical protein
MPIETPRRAFVKTTIGGGAAVLASSNLGLSANAAETLRIGFISPRSGPLAGFGEGDPYVLALVRKAVAKGVLAGGKPYAVEILDRDTQSDPTRAGQLAKDLIKRSARSEISSRAAPIGTATFRIGRPSPAAALADLPMDTKARPASNGISSWARRFPHSMRASRRSKIASCRRIKRPWRRRAQRSKR